MFVAGRPRWDLLLVVFIGGYLMAGGANAINYAATTTGNYTVEDLRESGAPVVFADLSDREAFLRQLD